MADESDKYDPFAVTQVEKYMKDILILGGTGAMGKHLVSILSTRGYNVNVTSRVGHQSTAGVRYIRGNAREESFLDSLLPRRWDAIVDFMIYRTAEFKLRAPKLLAATAQYIYLSSARVYADSSEPIQEYFPRLLDCSDDSDFLNTDEYSLAKARQEDILSQSGRTNWTIIRPYITYSNQRLQLGVFEKEGWLYRALKGRTIVFSEDIANKMTTLTYGFDVAQAITCLINEPEALGEAYHVTQREACRWSEILGIYLDVLERYLGARPKVLLLGLDDFSRCKPCEYQIKYDRLFNRVFDSSKIADFANVNAFLPLRERLTRCLEEFLEKPQFSAIDWRAEAIKDRHSGEVATLDEIGNWRRKVKYLIWRYIRS